MTKYDLFYVEDDADFTFLMENAINEVNNDLSFKIMKNGKDALEHLKKLTNDKIKPKVILLDLNLPGLSGLDLLKHIKEIPFLKYVPVIFFSTSDNPKDVKASLEFGANSYLVKPSGYLSLVTCFQTFHDYWFINNVGLN